jgi:aryl-alcohol dehydrogenase-like predicted oxidoreductase
MRYRTLPGTDLELSVVGMGCWAIGGTHWGDDVVDETSVAAVHTALDVGINWFDTAPLYGNGHGDEVLRSALGGRDDVIVATKVGVVLQGESGHAESKLDALHLREDLEASLRRLGREAIDLLQVHWPCQHGTPLEETFTTLQALKDEGKIRHIGVCNYGPDALDRLTAYADVVSLQTPYSLLRRELEVQALPICRHHGLGVLAYEPLCRGLLTGKFRSEPSFPDTDLRARDDRFKGRFFVHARRVAHDLGKLARRLEVSTAAVALGWVCAQPHITSAIAGAKTPAQVRENAQAHRFVDAPDLIEIIEKILHRHRGSRP